MGCVFLLRRSLGHSHILVLSYSLSVSLVIGCNELHERVLLSLFHFFPIELLQIIFVFSFVFFYFGPITKTTLFVRHRAVIFFHLILVF